MGPAPPQESAPNAVANRPDRRMCCSFISLSIIAVATVKYGWRAPELRFDRFDRRFEPPLTEPNVELSARFGLIT